MVRQKSRQEVSVHTIGVFNCVSNRKARLQVEQKAIISQRARKIEQNNILFSSLLQLDGEVYRHRARADSALGTHHHDELPRLPGTLRRFSLGIETEKRCLESDKIQWLGQKVLYPGPHGTQEHVRAGLELRTGDDGEGRMKPMDMVGELQARLCVLRHVQEHYIWYRFSWDRVEFR